MDTPQVSVISRKPLQKRAQKKVEAILLAARRCIETEGIEQLSALLVAREAGVPVGSVYFYFPTPMAMVEAMAEQWLASLRHAFTALLDPSESSPPVADWQAQLDILLRITYGDPERMGQRRFELQITKALDFYPELHALRQQHAEQMASLLTELLVRAGARWPRERLQRLARFGFEVVGALDNYLQQDAVDPGEAFGWARQALIALLAPCFDEREASAS